jgi:hypothetical protein
MSEKKKMLNKASSCRDTDTKLIVNIIFILYVAVCDFIK